MAITQNDLKAKECKTCGPNCTHNEMRLYPRCHRNSTFTLVYLRDQGVIQGICTECGRGRVEIAVAEGTLH